MEESSILHSHHIFIFPFKWEMAPPKEDFAERTSLQKLYSLLGDHPASDLNLPDTCWKRNRFSWKRDYNEAIYFHPHVRDVLFDTSRKNAGTVLQYHIDAKGKQFQYRIHLLPQKGDTEVFDLEVEEVTLNYYDTGIGFLAFHLNNYGHDSPQDILKINDFGRRIFPQFLGKGEDNLQLRAPKGAFLADRIELLHAGKPIASDDFEPVLNWINQHPKPLKADGLVPDFILRLLPSLMGKAVRFEPLLDDRMYVICWVGHKKWLDDATHHKSQRAALQWYSLIFVDGAAPGIANYAKVEELNRTHTYQRWVDNHLLYGVSRYSFVVLTDGEWFNRNIVLGHVQSMYFQLALLCLLQRGSVVRFSEEIARLSGQVASGERVERHSKAVQSVYAKYLQFVNKIYFREVTPQEQGIDLYKMVQEKMEIERDVKALQGEIQDFFNLLNLQSGERQAEAINTLTVVGSGLLAPTLILAYYGISAFSNAVTCKEAFTAWAAWMAVLGSISGMLAAYAWVKHWMGRQWWWLLPVAVLALSAWMPFWACWKICPDEPPPAKNLSIIHQPAETGKFIIQKFPEK